MTVKSVIAAACALGALSLAAGCTSAEQTQLTMEGAMYPAGYTDGCTSAREADKEFSTRVERDEALFRSDASYRTGWRQGFASCGDSMTGPNTDRGSDFNPF